MSIVNGWLDEGPLDDIESLAFRVRNHKPNYTPSILINVGTSGHMDHRKYESLMETAIKNIREAELALLMFGESLQHVTFPFKNIPLTSLNRRYMVYEDDEVVIKPNNKPYYRQFEKPLRGK